jgi:hypothetical protein
MSENKTIQQEVNDNIDPILNAYFNQMKRSVNLAEIIGNAIGHLRGIQQMGVDSSVQKYIDGAIADIQSRFKKINDEK